MSKPCLADRGSMGAYRQIITEAEEIVAAALVRARLPYLYEGKQFRFYLQNGMRAFRPDFYVPSMQLYIEVGTLRHKRAKLGLMRRRYPNVRVLVIDNTWAEEVAKIRGEDLKTWLWEKHVEQEYQHAYQLEDRILARFMARQGQLARVRPSMRTH